MKFLKFNNGLSMPILGIGTWQAPEAEVEAALDEALKAGYRHIDTAPVYLNEKAIGRVLKKWLDEGKVKREELFITTKLPPTGNRPGDVESRLRASLSDLQLDYVDLYLVHTPFTLVFDEVTKKFVVDENKEIKIEPTNHAAVWQKMEELVEKKLTKSIGISNFNKQQIERLLSTCKIPPANLQIEHHIYLQQPELISYCKEKGITVTAYSPLGSRGIVNINKAAGVEREIPSLMDVEEVKEIANSHGKTPAQVLLRWIVQNDICAIPKSTNAERLRQNLNVFDFELTAAEMQKLNSLDQQIRVCDFKFLPGVQKHPEFPFSN